MISTDHHRSKNGIAAERSSLFVSNAAIIVNFAAVAMCLALKKTQMAVPLCGIVIICIWSRIKSRRLAEGITGKLVPAEFGVFPGEELLLKVLIQNTKRQDVPWLKLYMPLNKRLSLIPDCARETEENETAALAKAGMSDSLVGELMVSYLAGDSRIEQTISFLAEKRGVYSTEYWQLRTGDRTGLTEISAALPETETLMLAVYPALVDVDIAQFLNNIWSTETGRHGTSEDITVIRSSRKYELSDSVRRINWKYLAKSRTMIVNLFDYESPGRVHFFFDGDDFVGEREYRTEAFEESLSIVASIITGLAKKNVICTMSFSNFQDGRPLDLIDDPDLTELLTALAAYELRKPEIDPEKHSFIRRYGDFKQDIFSVDQLINRYYYVAFDTEQISASPTVQKLMQLPATVLTYKESTKMDGITAVSLMDFKQSDKEKTRE